MFMSLAQMQVNWTHFLKSMNAQVDIEPDGHVSYERLERLAAGQKMHKIHLEGKLSLYILH